MSNIYSNETMPVFCALFILTTNFALSKRRASELPESIWVGLLYHPLRFRITTVLSSFVLAFLLTNLMAPLAVPGFLGWAQKPEKVIEKGASHPNQPVLIFQPKHVDKPVNFAEGFEGDDDWLKNTSFRVRNVSNREIVFLQLDFNFPETRSGGPEMSFPLSFGHHPNRDNAGKPPLSLLPGAEMDITLDQKTYQELTRFVEHRQLVKSINRAVVRVGFIVFADGLGYSSAYYVRQDPLDPKRWVPIAGAQGDPIIPPN